jgi:hypothetical protein
MKYLLLYTGFNKAFRQVFALFANAKFVVIAGENCF